MHPSPGLQGVEGVVSLHIRAFPLNLKTFFFKAFILGGFCILGWVSLSSDSDAEAFSIKESMPVCRRFIETMQTEGCTLVHF